MTNQYTLIDGQAMHKSHPATFEIPTPEEIADLKPGDYIKLGFKTNDPTVKGERMWCIFHSPGIAHLDNNPVFTDLTIGDMIMFENRHILTIMSMPTPNAPKVSKE